MRISLKTSFNLTHLYLLASLCENLPQNFLQHNRSIPTCLTLWKSSSKLLSTWPIYIHLPHFARIYLKTSFNIAHLYLLASLCENLPQNFFQLNSSVSTCLTSRESTSKFLSTYPIYTYLPHSVRISLKTSFNLTHLYPLTSLRENLPQNFLQNNPSIGNGIRRLQCS